jgi:NCS1 family nucleobase:cation symporter-1
MTAVKAFVPSAAVAIILALVPGLEALAPFSWFVGAALGAGLYYWLAKGQAAPVVPGVLPPRPV